MKKAEDASMGDDPADGPSSEQFAYLFQYERSLNYKDSLFKFIKDLSQVSGTQIQIMGYSIFPHFVSDGGIYMEVAVIKIRGDIQDQILKNIHDSCPKGWKNIPNEYEMNKIIEHNEQKSLRLLVNALKTLKYAANMNYLNERQIIWDHFIQKDLDDKYWDNVYNTILPEFKTTNIIPEKYDVLYYVSDNIFSDGMFYKTGFYSEYKPKFVDAFLPIRDWLEYYCGIKTTVRGYVYEFEVVSKKTLESVVLGESFSKIDAMFTQLFYPFPNRKRLKPYDDEVDYLAPDMRKHLVNEYRLLKEYAKKKDTIIDTLQKINSGLNIHLGLFYSNARYDEYQSLNEFVSKYEKAIKGLKKTNVYEFFFSLYSIIAMFKPPTDSARKMLEKSQENVEDYLETFEGKNYDLTPLNILNQNIIKSIDLFKNFRDDSYYNLKIEGDIDKVNYVFHTSNEFFDPEIYFFMKFWALANKYPRVKIDDLDLDIDIVLDEVKSVLINFTIKIKDLEWIYFYDYHSIEGLDLMYSKIKLKFERSKDLLTDVDIPVGLRMRTSKPNYRNIIENWAKKVNWLNTFRNANIEILEKIYNYFTSFPQNVLHLRDFGQNEKKGFENNYKEVRNVLGMAIYKKL